MNKEQARTCVLGIPAVASLDAALREKLADLFIEIGAPKRVTPSTNLFTREDLSDEEGIVLLEGDIHVSKVDMEDVTASGPDLLGEMARLNPNARRTATVTAATELKILVFRWSAFTAAAEERLSDEELKAFFSALQETAWTHFME